jgi:hypothetical protein
MTNWESPGWSEPELAAPNAELYDLPANDEIGQANLVNWKPAPRFAFGHKHC